MKKYLIILWYKLGCKEFTIISDRYPLDSQIVSASGINWDNIIDYEVHY